jgi:hypothetical protein
MNIAGLKIAVVGSRNFDNYSMLEEKLNLHILSNRDTIISGGARGADKLAERYARERGLELMIFKPNWLKGRGAGLLRNTDIVSAADKVVAFWDGISRGTADTIEKAMKQDKCVFIYRF